MGWRGGGGGGGGEGARRGTRIDGEGVWKGQQGRCAFHTGRQSEIGQGKLGSELRIGRSHREMLALLFWFPSFASVCGTRQGRARENRCHRKIRLQENRLTGVFFFWRKNTLLGKQHILWGKALLQMRLCIKIASCLI